MTQDFSPSVEELEANEMAMQADIQAMNKLLESDDALATAHAEIKKLNSEYAMLESRFNALMREKDKAWLEPAYLGEIAANQSMALCHHRSGIGILQSWKQCSL